MQGLESLSCKGESACRLALVELKRDLYCNGVSDTLPPPAGPYGYACEQAEFTFAATDSPQHVIECLGFGACYFSSFNMEENSNTSMLCDSNHPFLGACEFSLVDLPSGACLDLNCVQGSDCDGLTV